MKTNFYIKNYTRSLAFIMRFKATWNMEKKKMTEILRVFIDFRDTLLCLLCCYGTIEIKITKRGKTSNLFDTFSVMDEIN